MYVHRGQQGGKSRSLGLVLAANDRAYFLSRVDAAGRIEDPIRGSAPAVYTDDWSFRDYFNGGGNDFTGRGTPHAPVTATHISQTYKSQADDRPWKVDISAPITADDRVTFQAGTHSDAVTMSLAEFRRVAQPEMAYFGRHL